MVETGIQILWRPPTFSPNVVLITICPILSPHEMCLKQDKYLQEALKNLYFWGFYGGEGSSQIYN